MLLVRSFNLLGSRHLLQVVQVADAALEELYALCRVRIIVPPGEGVCQLRVRPEQVEDDHVATPARQLQGHVVAEVAAAANHNHGFCKDVDQDEF